MEEGPPPSLALYTVSSPAVFDSEIYLRTRGMGPWRELIDQRHYRRNLFDGLDAAPEVPVDGILLVAAAARRLATAVGGPLALYRVVTARLVGGLG